MTLYLSGRRSSYGASWTMPTVNCAESLNRGEAGGEGGDSDGASIGDEGSDGEGCTNDSAEGGRESASLICKYCMAGRQWRSTVSSSLSQPLEALLTLFTCTSAAKTKRKDHLFISNDKLINRKQTIHSNFKRFQFTWFNILL